MRYDIQHSLRILLKKIVDERFCSVCGAAMVGSGLRLFLVICPVICHGWVIYRGIICCGCELSPDESHHWLDVPALPSCPIYRIGTVRVYVT